jgi:hypothetical protein
MNAGSSEWEKLRQLHIALRATQALIAGAQTSAERRAWVRHELDLFRIIREIEAKRTP